WSNLAFRASSIATRMKAQNIPTATRSSSTSTQRWFRRRRWAADACRAAQLFLLVQKDRRIQRIGLLYRMLQIVCVLGSRFIGRLEDRVARNRARGGHSLKHVLDEVGVFGSCPQRAIGALTLFGA